MSSDNPTWEYRQPVRIRFGAGIVGTLADEIRSFGGRRGVLVTSRSFVRRGVAADVVAKSAGLVVATFGEVSPNPDVGECDACAGMMRREQADFVVALGGGSVMDLAKAAATFCLADRPSADYVGGAAIPAAHLPVIAVPTTAGTGSEITCVAVLSDHDKGLKVPLAAPGFYPALAIVDPEMTYSVPPYLTACTGFDVICHAIEAFWSRHHQPICDALALHAAELALHYLPAAYDGPADSAACHEARAKMAEASVIAGLAFTVPKTTSAHACSYPLTNLLGIPHGEACALTIDYFMRLNDRCGSPRPGEMARRLGYASASELADHLLALKRRLHLRTDLRDFHLDDAMTERLVRGSQHPNLLNNPVTVTVEMLRELYASLR